LNGTPFRHIADYLKTVKKSLQATEVVDRKTGSTHHAGVVRAKLADALFLRKLFLQNRRSPRRGPHIGVNLLSSSGLWPHAFEEKIVIRSF
jgi:hypothetical protein